MDKVDRTLKMRAFTGDPPADAAKDNLTREQALALELLAKNAQIEEERLRSIELLKIMEQMRESIAGEQAKALELAKKASQLEAEINALNESLGNISAIAKQNKSRQ